jgi:predicted secreted hydrolase
MAHFAITDISGEKYRFAQRINRSGVGWAGASTGQYHVWNQDWEVRLNERGEHHLIARNDAISIDLVLLQGKLPVRHGRNGFSQKGSQSGNASLYYSMTRMPTSGQLSFEGRNYSVAGLTWMDHEFGTSFLEEGQVGWDWFSIQLEDGTDLMLFQLRRVDGQVDSHSSGTWVDAAGHATPLQMGDCTMKGTESWQSDQSGAQYPTKWQIHCAPLRLDLTVKPTVLNQELRTKESTGVNYWEGAVEVTGTREGSPVKGRGYLEMTGYGGQVMSRLFGL